MIIHTERDFPVQWFWPSDYLLQRRALNGSIAQVGHTNGFRLGLGKGTTPATFDLAKLKADGVYVDRRPHGGAGSMSGPMDVFFSIHVNRLDLHKERIRSDQPPAAEIYRHFVTLLQGTVTDLGIEARINDQGAAHGKREICAELSGRSEIVSERGHKLVVSVFEDDGLIVSIYGVYMVSSAWSLIYEYLKVPAPCGVEAVGIDDLMSERYPSHSSVRESLISKFQAMFEPMTRAYAEKTEREREVMRKLAPQYRVEL